MDKVAINKKEKNEASLLKFVYINVSKINTNISQNIQKILLAITGLMVKHVIKLN